MKTFSFDAIRQLAVLWIIFGFALASGVNAQTAEDALRFSRRFPANGAVMLGRGGAGIAGVADYSAMSINPAGLGFYDSSAFTGSLSALRTGDDGAFRISGASSGLNTNVNDTRLGHLAYIYKFPTARGSLVIGAAFTQVNTFERSLNYSGENPSNSITDFLMPVPGEFTLENGSDGVFPNFTRDLSFIGFETFAIDLNQGLVDAGDPVPFLPAVTAGTVLQTGNVVESGRMKEVNIGGAGEAAPGVMVGLSVNIPFGTYRFNRIFEEDDFRNDNNGTGGTTDFNFLSLNERVKSELIGVNVRAGVTAQLNRLVRVGLTVESPTYYNIDESFDTRLETIFDNGDSFIYGDQPDENAGSGVFKYDINTPWRLGAGLTLENARISVSADAEYVDWSQLELKSKNASFADENRFITQNLDAVINTRIGVQYTFGDVDLRGGFDYQPDPRKATGGLDRDKTYFSAGLGYRFDEQVQVDLGWMQERFDDRYLPYSEVTNAPVVNEQVTRNRFSLGFKLLF